MLIIRHTNGFCLFSASVTIALQILKRGEVVDDWFQLRASNCRTEAGTIRLKARYMVRYCTLIFDAYLILLTSKELVKHVLISPFTVCLCQCPP